MIAYLITNKVNGKRYVGITSRGLLCRWREHLSDASCGRGFLLHRAIRKHGENQFDVEQIASCVTPKDISIIEISLIAEYKTRTPHGYNMTCGGEGATGREVSSETRRKISVAHIGKVLSEAHKAKMAQAKLGKKLKPFTADHRRRISEARMGHGFSSESLLKMSKAKKGKPWTENRRKAFSERVLQ